MKFISWNVNGLRACLKKGFLDFYREQSPDFICLQETKMEQGQAHVDLEEGCLEFWNSAEKKGYSGTAVFTHRQPLSVAYGMDKDLHDHEGRLITLEYEQFYLVCCYTPNAQDELKRIDYRMQWDDDFRAHIQTLDRMKPVIVCGDFNDTPMSYVYRTMAKGLNDAFSRSGSGYSHTFRGFFNTLRIDYVLCSDSFEPISYEVPAVDYSDHLPVVVRLKKNLLNN